VGKQCRVRGLFILEVNAKDMRDAQETAERILANSGIEGYVIEVEEVRSFDTRA
jgi:phosphoribosylformylglycinamidine (FGAM) synthase PurS component